MQQHDFTHAAQLAVIAKAVITPAEGGWHLCIYVHNLPEPKSLKTKDGNTRLFKTTDAAVNSCASAGLSHCIVEIRDDSRN